MEYTKLKEKIKILQEQLDEFPSGKLVCSYNKNRYKWYRSDGREKAYIPKANRSLAEQLAVKQYLTLMLEDLSIEAKALGAYLKICNGKIGKAEQLLKHKEYKQLLNQYFTPISEELSQWAKSDYEHNEKYPEHLIHKSYSGNLLRSKSEAMIDMLLYIHKIPFRYECALQLGELIIFPDFTIRHPITGNVYYWEHFGMMDQERYAKNACSKLELYVSQGIIPSIQLITTYETKEHPLTADEIENIIRRYFV